MNMYEIVKMSQEGDKDALLEAINKFTPLIKKYSHLLDYDGAESDLVIKLIEIVYKIPLEKNTKMQNQYCIIKYITVSIINVYVHLAEKNAERTYMELVTDIDFTKCSNTDYADEHLYIKDLLAKLSKWQRKIIEELFIKSISEKELAQQMHISIQSVNKTKIRALNNLRKLISVE